MTDKAMRFNTGKMDLTYMLEFPKAFRLFCLICIGGEYKYGRGNFKAGGKPDLEYFKSLMRHIQDSYTAHAPGEARPDWSEVFDDDSGVHSAGHAIWNLIAWVELNVPEDMIMRFDTMDEFYAHCEETAKKYKAQREEAERVRVRKGPEMPEGGNDEEFMPPGMAIPRRLAD